jgi:ATP phosphoribosyltransferase
VTFSLAVPNKGRLKEPSVRLLRDAGLSFEVTDRALSVPVRNVDMELLFVRTEDIPELVSDGVADVGITGIDLVEEHGNGLASIVELGYGHCRLVAAVPNASTIESTDDFGGLRVATAHPNSTAAYFSRRSIDVDVVSLRGSVEVATKIGVADAIVDLVSTGSTLRVNGLRAVGTLVDSQAILLSRKTDVDSVHVTQVATALRAVTAGRRKRYLLLNSPVDAERTIVDLIPGLEAPTVMPLAEDGWVAIHSVVDAEHLWELLPQLEAAGGKGILVLPIEQLL